MIHHMYQITIRVSLGKQVLVLKSTGVETANICAMSLKDGNDIHRRKRTCASFSDLHISSSNLF